MTIPGGSSGGISGGIAGTPPAPTHNPLVYDSGLGKPLRTIVRDAVIQLLQRLHVNNGGYIAAIEPTATPVRGAADDNGFMQLYEQLNGRTPAIFVRVGDKSYQTAGTAVESWMGTLDVHVYVFVNSLRGITERLSQDVVSEADATADPGTELILEHVEELLIGQNPGGTRGQIKELRPTSENHLGTEETNELWEQIYTARIARSIKANRDVTLEITQINTYARLADHQTAADPPILETDTEL